MRLVPLLVAHAPTPNDPIYLDSGVLLDDAPIPYTPVGAGRATKGEEKLAVTGLLFFHDSSKYRFTAIHGISIRHMHRYKVEHLPLSTLLFAASISLESTSGATFSPTKLSNNSMSNASEVDSPGGPSLGIKTPSFEMLVCVEDRL
jgi:hypothetical protein